VQTVSGSSGALYALGRFSEPAGDWAIVNAVCQPGNSDASVVTTKAQGEFGKFDVVMFVGVAGSVKEDVPIGTVVAGNYVYSAHSGKEEDHGFQSRPHSHAAANELIHAANALILDESWLDLIKAPQRTTLPPVDKYPCPYPPVAVIKGI
jgi:nucleoside phosphorylase